MIVLYVSHIFNTAVNCYAQLYSFHVSLILITQIPGDTDLVALEHPVEAFMEQIQTAVDEPEKSSRAKFQEELSGYQQPLRSGSILEQ